MGMKIYLLVALGLLMNCNVAKAQTIAKSDKILVVYFSHSGNTKLAAEKIHNLVGGDIFAIEPINAYPEEYRVITKQAKKEITEGFKPALKSKVDNIENYDVIFVGSPCWWSTIAPPVTTFLSENDLSGKTVIPFMTHGGSGLGRSVADIKTLLPAANVTEGQAFRGNDVKNANEEITVWVKGLKNE